MLKSVEAMTYDGVDLDATFNEGNASEAYFLVERVRGRTIPPSDLSLVSTPTMAGSHVRSTRKLERILEVDMAMKGVSHEDLHRRLEQLASILVVKNPVPITFEDESDRVYYGMFTDLTVQEDRSRVVKFTVTIVCPDPYKYSHEIQATFPGDAVYLTNDGSAETPPIFQLEATQPSSYALIQNQFDEYMMIGKPVDVESVEVEPRTTILNDAMNSLVGWGTASSGIIDGAVSGTMMADSYRFYTTDYGSGPSWHGPAVIRSISETLTDFTVEVTVELLNTQPSNTGRIELYLVDSANNVVGKLAMKNVDQGSNRNYAEIRIGDSTVHHYLIHEFGGTESTWANFYGILRMSRRGNVWEAYVARIDGDGNHVGRRYVSWEDRNNQFTRDVASVVAHLGQAGDKSVTTNRIHHLKVFRLNDVSKQETPYIVDEGDIIELDHENKLIRINGEVRKDLKQFGADYFNLKPGENQLLVFPEDTFNTNMSFRERSM